MGISNTYRLIDGKNNDCNNSNYWTNLYSFPKAKYFNYPCTIKCIVNDPIQFSYFLFRFL